VDVDETRVDSCHSSLGQSEMEWHVDREQNCRQHSECRRVESEVAYAPVEVEQITGGRIIVERYVIREEISTTSRVCSS
jgi:hypothetical protein